MNPKFTLITHDYPPAHGGVARYLSSLVAAADREISVLVPLGHLATGEIRNTKYEKREVDFWSSTWPHWLPLIKRCLEVPDDQTILVSHVFPIGTAAFIADALGGPEYAVIFHGTDLKRVNTKWKRWLLRHICHNAQILIVNSEATKKILMRLVPNADPLMLTPGLEPFELPDRGMSRERLNVASDTKVILAVSRLVERKGIDTLIQSVAKVAGTYPNVEIVIVGDGEYAEPLHELAELTRVKIRWVPNAADEAVHAWYSAADIFCLPGREASDDIEGFGMVFLEAASAGLPVIAGDSGGASEAVVNNQTGLLISPTVDACAEAITKLIEDTELARRLGVAGRARVIADFNWSDRWNKLNSKLQTANYKELSELTRDERYERVTLNVSVVIPCYNHAKELKDTLESVANQTVGVKEVIIVDDGSSDNPASVAEHFKNNLPLTFIKLDQNSGAPVARNRGAEISSGEFIIFLDADAILKPCALEVLHKTLNENPQAAYAYSDFMWGNHHFKGMPFNAEKLRAQSYIHTSALIRASDLIKFDESLKKFQDWDLWLSMLELNKVGVWVPETLFTISERKTGISQWLPSFMYKIPWPILGYTPKAINRYREAERVIKTKHHLEY